MLNVPVDVIAVGVEVIAFPRRHRLCCTHLVLCACVWFSAVTILLNLLVWLYDFSLLSVFFIFCLCYLSFLQVLEY